MLLVKNRSALWRKNNPAKVARDNKRRRQRADNRDLCYLKRLYGWVYSRCHHKTWAATQYRDRGIQCLVDLYDIALIWIRDRAWLIENPHLDRINPDGHYELGNIRFITRDENMARRRRSVEEEKFFEDDEQPQATNGERVPGEDDE